MRNGKRKHKDVFAMIESKMTPATVRRSDAKAKKMILSLRLAAFRRQIGNDEWSVKEW